MKRALDLFVASCVLLCLCIPLLALAWRVRSKLGSPVFFTQTRPGLNGKPFKMIKFRSMTDARGGDGQVLSAAQARFHAAHCARRTRLGRGLSGFMPIFSSIVLLFGMTIFSALFTDSQSRLFIWLFGQPVRAYHLSELRRFMGLGSASLQRELNRLATAGLVDSQTVGNMRRFQANPKSPVFAELVALTRKTLGTVPILRDALLPLMPDLLAAWVYGSVAKQTDTARSDIDIMLVGNNLLLSNVLACLVPAEAQLGRKINPSCYSPEEFERRRAEPDSFVNRVLSQPILALIGDAHEPARAG